MIEIGKHNQVSFKVNVNGSSSAPIVRFVIETPNADLSFNAVKSGDSWVSDVFIPEEFTANDYDVRVEVLVNSRLFTPLKKKMTIASRASIAAETITPPTPTQTPQQTETWEDEGGAVPLKKVEEPTPLPPEKPVVPPTPTYTPAPPPAPKTPQAESLKLMKETTKKTFTPVRTPLPSPSKNKAEPIKIKISEIAADSDARFESGLSENTSYKKPGKAVTPININQQTPVTLKKGEVVYE
jgi:hypothetical protein